MTGWRGYSTCCRIGLVASVLMCTAFLSSGCELSTGDGGGQSGSRPEDRTVETKSENGNNTSAAEQEAQERRAKRLREKIDQIVTDADPSADVAQPESGRDFVEKRMREYEDPSTDTAEDDPD